ncbi:hypothetical protein LIER_27277 [Lithospermum erythrorhizon]|uniref:Reverse transcriptase Ty1/copia-type domain-containing protein n=1 Tax=Lithospermum erythrorhizon TaxID=34254 RepID=A0AAV3RFI6_LITER
MYVLGYADGVKGYRLCDPIARKVIISRGVIFAKDKLQKEDINDSTERKNSETTTVNVENKSQQQDSSEEELVHENQEPTESGDPPVETESPEIRRSSRLTRRPDTSLWMTAMQEEIEALHKNKTWDLVPLPQGRKPIDSKWVYKIKRHNNDQVEHYRARLIVK